MEGGLKVDKGFRNHINEFASIINVILGAGLKNLNFIFNGKVLLVSIIQVIIEEKRSINRGVVFKEKDRTGSIWG